MSHGARASRHAIVNLKTKALSAAADIVAKRGVEELNLRAIAEAAGIGIASIYYYFENKEALVLDLAIHGFEDLRRDILEYQIAPEHDSPMQGGARAYLAFVQNNHALISLMFDERLMARHESLREAEHRTFLAYETAVRADRQVPPQHQAVAAFALWALGRGMAAIMSSYPGGKMPPELFEKMRAGAAYLLHHPD